MIYQSVITPLTTQLLLPVVQSEQAQRDTLQVAAKDRSKEEIQRKIDIEWFNDYKLYYKIVKVIKKTVRTETKTRVT